MPTIKDVAKKAGVSVATASYAINGDERIEAETRQKVIDAAIELQYIPNGNAKNLKRQKSNIVLVFVSSFGGPIYQEILSYLDEKLTKLDYRMIICNGSLATNIIEEKIFDAIINLDATIDSRMLELISRFYPVIDTTRDYECKRMVSLPIPGAEPVYEATLMAINDGYKKIGFMHGSIDSYDDKERFKGFILALDEFSLSPYCILQGRFTTASGYDAIKEYLFNNNELPEVLI
jgi:LacI family transcriptional regulator